MGGYGGGQTTGSATKNCLNNIGGIILATSPGIQIIH
jgi:hypothetical protein